MYKDLETDHPSFYNYDYLTPEKLAYWAGILDGEGCLRFDERGIGRLPGVTLSMTCEKTIRAFQEDFKLAKIITRTRNGMEEHWKDCYTAKATTHMAAKMCEKLYPFMITKHDIAKEIAEFYICDCDECGSKFWKFGSKQTCSQKCTQERKRRMNRVPQIT